VDEFQQLVSAQGQGFEAMLVPGRRPYERLGAGNHRSVKRPGKDGEYAVVCKATGDRARWSDMEAAAGRYHLQSGG
jgi:hypothetical protein